MKDGKERSLPQRPSSAKPLRKGDLLDPCVLSAVASRPHARANWVDYELRTEQQPSDFAEVTKVEYRQDHLKAWWRLSCSATGLTASDNVGTRCQRLKQAIAFATKDCFSQQALEGSLEVSVEYLTKIASAESVEDGGSLSLVAGLVIQLLSAQIDPSADAKIETSAGAPDAKVDSSANDVIAAAANGAGFAEALAASLTEALRKQSFGDVAQICPETLRLVMPHPSEIDLCGGLGEPVWVQSVPEDSELVRCGASEGFELVWYECWDDVSGRWCKETDFAREIQLPGEKKRRLRPDEIFARETISLPARLFFQSPLTRLPNLSQRQLAEALGLRGVKELHFRRLVAELAHSWTRLQVNSRADLLEIHKICDETLELSDSVTVGGSQAPLSLPSGSLLRAAGPATRPLRKRDLEVLAVPVRLRVGTKRTEVNMNLKQFHTALCRAGIHWLNPDEEQDLLGHTKPTEEDLDRYGDTAWEMALADRFLYTEGLYVHVGRVVKSHHILAITKALQRRLTERTQQDGFFGASLSFNDFESAMQVGGITWLDREQVGVLFNNLKGKDADGITLADWLSRFRWQPLEAAMEVQRAFEVGNAPKTHSAKRRASKRPAVKKLDLDFRAFQTRLLDLGVGWLSVEQQRVIFDTMDVDKSGNITEEELATIADVRQRLEDEREEKLKAEMEARAAAEAEAEKAAKAAAEAAQAEKEAEAQAAKAAMEAKAEAELEKVREQKQSALNRSGSAELPTPKNGAQAAAAESEEAKGSSAPGDAAESVEQPAQAQEEPEIAAGGTEDEPRRSDEPPDASAQAASVPVAADATESGSPPDASTAPQAARAPDGTDAGDSTAPAGTQESPAAQPERSDEPSDVPASAQAASAPDAADAAQSGSPPDASPAPQAAKAPDGTDAVNSTAPTVAQESPAAQPERSDAVEIGKPTGPAEEMAMQVSGASASVPA